jgi:hypothetical protein
LPDPGKTKQKFKSRTELFIGPRHHDMMGEIYDVRSPRAWSVADWFALLPRFEVHGQGSAHPLDAAVPDAEFLEMCHSFEQILRAGPERPRRVGDAFDRPLMRQILRIGVAVAIGNECYCLGCPSEVASVTQRAR